jgi:hypothetical protein
MDEKIVRLTGDPERWTASRNGYPLRDQFGKLRTFRTREDAAKALRELRDLQEPTTLTQE